MTKGFPETFPFRKLTGRRFPSQSLERTSWVVNTDARGRRGHSGEIRVAQGGRSLPTDAGWATPRRLPELKSQSPARCFSGPRKAWSNECILGARNRAGTPGRSTLAPPDPSLQKMEPGVRCLRVNLGCNCARSAYSALEGLCVSSSFWAQTGHEGRAGARAPLRMPRQRLRAQPASSAGGRHIQGRVGLTCVFSPDSYLTTPSSFPQPCLSLPCYRKRLWGHPVQGEGPSMCLP